MQQPRLRPADRAAEVIVTYGVLNDPGASLHSRGALWRESWGQSYPMCGACWNSSRQVAITYRPRLIVRDLTRQGPAPAASRAPAQPNAVLVTRQTHRRRDDPPARDHR